MKIIFGLLFVCGLYSFFGCKKSKLVPLSQPQDTVAIDTAGVDTLYYSSFQLDSVSYTEYGLTTGYEVHIGSSGVAVNSGIIPISGLGGPYDWNTDYWPWDTTAFIETIGGINSNSDSGATAEPFDSLFSPGANFKYGLTDTTGVLIQWVDRSGLLWSTNLGPADQTGSTFLITELKLDTPSSLMTITAGFNCNLYDSAGDKKILTNGKSRLPFLGELTQ